MSPEVLRRIRADRRAWLLPAALVVVLTVALVAAGLLAGGSDDSPSHAAATTSPAPDANVPAPAISPSPTGPTDDADELPPSQDPVPLDASTQVGEVTVRLRSLEAIEGAATGPGDVAGPALRATVRLENGTGDPLDLLGVSVVMSYGADALPASPLGDPSVAAFAGTLEPGGVAEGVYVFSVPAEAREAVTVSVGYQPGAPYAVFTGAA
jgi:hypothetical protein